MTVMTMTPHRFEAMQRVIDQLQTQNNRLVAHRRLLSLLQENVPGFLLAHRQVESMLYEADAFMTDLYDAVMPEPQPRPSAIQEASHLALLRNVVEDEEPLPLRRHARTVREVVQDRHFALMLDAIESAASDMSLVFERGLRGEELTFDQIRSLGEAALRAQMKFMAPGETECVRDVNITNLRESGDAIQCAAQILSALEQSHIVIQSRFPSRREVGA